MTHAEIRALEQAGRTTAVWSAEPYDSAPNFGEVFRALLPATLILATAAALLVAML